MKTLRIRPESGIPLPHKIQVGPEKLVVFNPDGELDDAEADGQLKTHPHIYEIAKGEPDASKYVWKKDFVQRVMVDETNDLSEEDQGKVFKFIDDLKLKAAERKKADEAKAEKELADKLRKQAAVDLAKRKQSEKNQADTARAAKPPKPA